MALERIVGGVMETESRLTWIEELVKGENGGREHRQVLKDICCI